MNINKLTLNGIEYNLTDKDAQSKIVSIQENTYTKAEVDAAIENVDVTDQLADYAKKSELPAEYDDTAIKSRIKALEDKEDKDTVYDDTALTNRVKALENIDHSQYLTEHQDVSGKVDKVSGKGLSTNDYTDADKAKLAATPSFWVGTQAEYDAIAVKDNHTFYYITE